MVGKQIINPININWFAAYPTPSLLFSIKTSVRGTYAALLLLKLGLLIVEMSSVATLLMLCFMIAVLDTVKVGDLAFSTNKKQLFSF